MDTKNLDLRVAGSEHDVHALSYLAFDKRPNGGFIASERTLHIDSFQVVILDPTL